MRATAIEININGNTARFEQLKFAEADMKGSGFSDAISTFDDDDVHSA